MQSEPATTTETVPRVTEDGRRVRFVGDSYSWSWSRNDDRVEIHDAAGRLVVTATNAPAIVVQRDDAKVCVAGPIGRCTIGETAVDVEYDAGNGSSITVTWRFDRTGIWIEPLRLRSHENAAVVSVHWFAIAGPDPKPTLSSAFLVHPGICMAPTLSPIVPAAARLDLTTWLGRGSSNAKGPAQQWGLPAHYLCGFHSNGMPLLAGDVGERASMAYCLGAADLPDGDLMLRIAGGCAAPVLMLRGDLWGQVRTATDLTLGPRWRMSFGVDYRAAAAAYQRDLIDAHLIEPKQRSTRRDETLSLPQFNTWGAQTATGTMASNFDQDRLEAIYREFSAVASTPGLFVIDDKWEADYGALEHDRTRFSDFEGFLDRVRGDGHRVGLWAAFLRCDDPAKLGLGPSHMLQGRDGAPLRRPGGYYLYDITQPDVSEAVAESVRRFMRRYRPNLVKFDFGYELPALADSVPHDPHYAGERLLGHALDVVVPAMRDVDPDVVVMYYSLSPLLAEHLDLISADDLVFATGDFAAEANRRLYFSSVLCELGIPSCGSSGYDSHDIEQIWFDSVASGPIGSLGPFASGRPADRLSQQQIAVYNGLSRLARQRPTATITPLGDAPHATVSGARTSSWARYEESKPVLVTLRAQGFAGAPGCGRFDSDGIHVETNGTVAVGSLTDDGLAGSAELGLVNIGPAHLRIRRDGLDSGAELTSYDVEGSARLTREVSVDATGVDIDLPDRLPDGTYIQYSRLRLR